MTSMNMIYLVCLIVAILVVAAIGYYITQGKKKKETACPIDIEALIHALGGKDNIESSESTPSKLKVYVVEENKIAPEAIKGLGASGIVIGKKSITMIFGKASSDIENALNERL